MSKPYKYQKSGIKWILNLFNNEYVNIYIKYILGQCLINMFGWQNNEHN